MTKIQISTITLRDAIQNGRAAYKEEQYHDALISFEEGLWYIEDDLDLLLWLATTCRILSEYERAKTAYRSVLSAYPDNVYALKGLGDLCYLRNEPEDAKSAWSHALALEPDDKKLKKRLSKLQKELSAMEILDVDARINFEISYDGTTLTDYEYAVLEIMENAYHDIGHRLFVYPKRQISVLLLTKEAFYDITESPEWSTGWYEGQIKIPVAGADSDDLNTILYHEYVHAVLYDQMRDACPWWLNEGLAQYLSGKVDSGLRGGKFDQKNVSIRYDVNIFELTTVRNMNKEDASRAYASALSAVQYLYQTYGETSARTIIEYMADGETFESAFQTETWYSFEEFVSGWKQYAMGEAQ